MDLRESKMDIKCQWKFILLVIITVCYMCVVYWRHLVLSYVSIFKMEEDLSMIHHLNMSKIVSSTNRELQSLSSPFHTLQIVRYVSQISTTQSVDAKNNTKPHYICMYNVGGLGNQMFQFAAAYGIAKKKHMRIAAKKQLLVRQIFEMHEQIEVNEINCRLARRMIEQRACSFDQRLFDISSEMNYLIGIYTQSWKYFKHSEKELRKLFVFKNHTSNIAHKIIQNILQKYTKTRSKVTLIGVHVRRGDMVNNGHGYRTATKGYFKKAIDYYRRKFKDAVFVVCSNDMKWCKQNINRTNRIVFIEHQNREVDLAILGSCDHVIQSVGSFSWWAAWLAGGTSVFFKWPAREGSALRREFSKDYSDYFYPGWIGMQ